jgi:drug/metabolite transporter (DMT)-like permease
VRFVWYSVLSLIGVVLILAGVVVWVYDPLAAVGEYGDGGGDNSAIVVPLLFVGSLFLLLAWFPALRRRTRRDTRR